ncbi:Rik1-associated factor 1 [Asimina triloba]
MFALAPPKSLSFFPTHTHLRSPLLPALPIFHLPKTPSTPLLKPISASKLPTPPPPPSPSDQLYQPFRPPPSSQSGPHQSLSLDDLLGILRNRLGLWHHYAPHISTLHRHFSFSAPALEESTGISGGEQNRLIVAVQVRDSLIASKVDDQVLSFFDIPGGAELLYELRLLSAAQRAAAARYFADRRVEDTKAAQDVARAIKDFPRRRGEEGWECFSPTPGDCLAFMHFRLSREHRNEPERTVALQRAMEAVDTDRAKLRVSEDFWKGQEGAADADDGDAARRAARVRVPVVRMRIGEVAEASSVVVMPVCGAEEGESGVAGAPDCCTRGEFGIVTAEKPWGKWVVLPGWGPVAEIEKGGIVVGFKDGRVLPWKVGRKSYMEEEILVVVNREKKDVVEEEGFYLVVNSQSQGQDGGLRLERGDKLKDGGVQDSLGMVALVVRPPTNENDLQLLEEDWE